MGNIIGGNFGGVDLNEVVQQAREEQAQKLQIAIQLAHSVVSHRMLTQDLKPADAENILSNSIGVVNALFAAVKKEEAKL